MKKSKWLIIMIATLALIFALTATSIAKSNAQKAASSYINFAAIGSEAIVSIKDTGSLTGKAFDAIIVGQTGELQRNLIADYDKKSGIHNQTEGILAKIATVEGAKALVIDKKSPTGIRGNQLNEASLTIKPKNEVKRSKIPVRS